MSADRPHDRRRGVTRGYVAGLIGATSVIALALVVACWGGITYFTGRAAVSTPGVGIVAAELIVLTALLALAWGLWSQALALLRGRRTPPWAHTLVLAGGAYLIWCLGGVLAGLGIQDTWLSPFAALLAPIWAVCSLIFWFVLARRVYTDRPTPKWPWERHGEPGPERRSPEDPGGAE